MAISLQKGQKVDLTKDNPGLSKLIIGLGWDTNKYDGRADFDLDTAAFLLTETGKVSGEKDFVFYSNLKHPSGGVTHLGDNRTGIGDGDDEQIKVDLTLIPGSIHKIDFTATIYEAEARRQNFGQVSNAYIRVFDEVKKIELLRFDLGEDFSVETAVVAAELYRSGAEWKFNAIGMGFQGGLGALATNFGIAVA
ncbi:MAG: TerD family protein [Spirochaetaceae bacterium]|jgi:tellurium resistance protein TerD|nr:TerD family protein [Spirochaetaceae bacterium]